MKEIFRALLEGLKKRNFFSSLTLKPFLLLYVGVLIFFGIFGVIVIRQAFEEKSPQEIDAAQAISSQQSEASVSDFPDEAQNTIFQEELVRRLLDGVLVKKGEENIRPVSVMVDNFIDARPLLGISKAQLVFEAPVEAGITRLLAVYSQPEAVLAGPVRSSRPYFIDWAEEFGAVYAHVGGSEAALKRLQIAAVVNADDILGRDYYTQESSRRAPHHIYADTGKLLLYAEELGWERTRDFTVWKYRDETPQESREEATAGEISIDFRPSSNMAIWKYSSKKNDYLRHEGEFVFMDQDGVEVRAKNVILAHTDMKILDEVGRRKFYTLGSGKADIFLEGGHISGIWQKEDPKDRMKFFDDAGVEVEFVAGTTWVEIVPTKGVEYRVE